MDLGEVREEDEEQESESWNLATNEELGVESVELEWEFEGSVTK